MSEGYSQSLNQALDHDDEWMSQQRHEMCVCVCVCVPACLPDIHPPPPPPLCPMRALSSIGRAPRQRVARTGLALRRQQRQPVATPSLAPFPQPAFVTWQVHCYGEYRRCSMITPRVSLAVVGSRRLWAMIMMMRQPRYLWPPEAKFSGVHALLVFWMRRFCGRNAGATFAPVAILTTVRRFLRHLPAVECAVLTLALS